jgi:preprotein translocase subunit Sec61beta
MAESGRIRMPVGTGGLVRYYDEYRSKFQIKPIYVLLLILLTIILELSLKIFFQ